MTITTASDTAAAIDPMELARAVVQAEKAHNTLVYAKTDKMTDDELAAREIALLKSRRAYLDAMAALRSAV